MQSFESQQTKSQFPNFEPVDLTELLRWKGGLVVAHPGHELCLYGWLALAKPVVLILTDGSGRDGVSRLPSTLKTLSAAGARPGEWFGKYADQQVYQALLHHDFHFFRTLVFELADALTTAAVDYVVGDAVEGYNPSHDICRLVINAAVGLLNDRSNGCRIQTFDFPIIGGNLPKHSLTLELDQQAFERKTRVIRSYPELADEVSFALDEIVLGKLQGLAAFGEEIMSLVKARGGKDFFRREVLRPINENVLDRSFADVERMDALTVKPYYERYAEMLVAVGRYQQVIRYTQHVAPVAEALRNFTTSADSADFRKQYSKR